MTNERVVYIDATTGVPLRSRGRRKALTEEQIARIRRMQARIDSELAPKYGVPLPASSHVVSKD